MQAAATRQRAEQLAATLPPLLVAAEQVAATVAQVVHGRRQSAKSERIFVREHDREAAQSIWLWRDDSPSMHYASGGAPCDKVERATVLLLATAALLLRAGEFAGLLGPRQDTYDRSRYAQPVRRGPSTESRRRF